MRKFGLARCSLADFYRGVEGVWGGGASLQTAGRAAMLEQRRKLRKTRAGISHRSHASNRVDAAFRTRCTSELCAAATSAGL